eukprot:6197285-Pleurochrysis_carterae.AAC.2
MEGLYQHTRFSHHYFIYGPKSTYSNQRYPGHGVAGAAHPPAEGACGTSAFGNFRFAVRSRNFICDLPDGSRSSAGRGREGGRDHRHSIPPPCSLQTHSAAQAQAHPRRAHRGDDVDMPSSPLDVFSLAPFSGELLVPPGQRQIHSFHSCPTLLST